MFMWPVNLHMPPALLVKECPVDAACKALPRTEQGESKWKTSILRLLVWGDIEGDTWSHLHPCEAQLLDGRHLKMVVPSILPLLL